MPQRQAYLSTDPNAGLPDATPARSYLSTDPNAGQVVEAAPDLPVSRSTQQSRSPEEVAFRQWYATQASRLHLSPDPDDPEQFYDYRAAFRAGVTPNASGHWPSQFKRAGHPNEVVGGFNTRTGERVPGATQASESELVRLGWDPATAAQLTRDHPPARPSLLDRIQLAVMRMGPTAAGATIGSVGGPIGAAIGGGIGALAGEYGAEMREQDLGARKAINPTQLAVQTGLGAVPMGRVAGATVSQIAARRALQGIAMGGAASGLTESAETGEWPSLRTVGEGMALGGVLGYGAGQLEGRGLRRMGRLDVPQPPPAPRRPVRGLLGPGPSFVAGPSGEITPTARASEGGTLATDGGGVVSRPDTSGVRSVPAAAIAHDFDPLQDPARALSVRQYSGDVQAVPSPVLGDADREMLQRMRADLDAFPSEPSRLIRDPHDPGFDRYSYGGPGTEVGDDIRKISGTRAGNGPIAAAIDDLLSGKPLTNKLHVAALDAARGYLEGRSGYQGPRLPASEAAAQAGGRGGEAVDDFERFASSLDEVSAGAPSALREPGEEGFIANQLLLRGGGALGGAAIGAASGDTPQERIENALLGATAGVLAPSLLPRRGGPRAPAIVASPQATTRAPFVVTSGEGRAAGRAGNLNPPTSQRAFGRPRPDPLEGTEGFLERVSAGNPILRDGIAERLRAANGYDAQRRGVLGVEATGELANRVRVDVGRALPRGTAPNAETVVAYTRAANQTMTRVRELGARLASGQATDADVLAFAAAQADADVVLKSVMGLRSEAGRALAAFRSFSAVLETGDVNLIRQAVNPLREDAARLAGEVARRGTPLEQYQYLQSLGKSSFADKARSYYYSSILSGVKTHERNALGNAASITSRMISTPFAAGIDAARSALTGAPRTVRLGELQPAVVGAVAGMERGFGDFLFTLRHGVSPDALSRSVSAATDLGRLDLPRVEFGGGAANPFNWPGRGLDATDAFFRNVARQQELYASAWTQARNEGLSGRRLVDRAADLRLDEGLRSSSDRFAAESVFQHKPGPIIGLLQSLQRRIPGAAFIAPFLKTPGNILRAGAQMSPAGFFTKAAREGGRVGTQAQGMAALGTMLLAPIAWLAATGRLSGAGPSDPAERAALMESGWRPNSIRIGDRWVEYALVQPISMQASVVANAFEGWQRDGAREQDLGAVVGEVMARVGNTVLEQSFLSGLNDVFEAMKNPERAGANVVGRLAHSFTPFAGVQRTATQVLDPVVRQPKTAQEVFRSNVPGLSTSVDPRLTRFGEQVQRPTGAMAAVDPFNVSPVVHDPIADELTRLKVALSLPSERLRLPNGVELDSEASLRLRESKGRLVRQVLERVISEPRYQRLSDDQRRRVLERAKAAANERANREARVSAVMRSRAAGR